jgi:hypothetical protein
VALRFGCCVNAGDENRVAVAVAAMKIDRMMAPLVNAATRLVQG